MTNFPLTPFWNETVTPSDPETSFSISRRAHLMSMAGQYKGAINTTVMKTILDTPYSRGGASFQAETLDGTFTIYQFVYVPETRTFTLKAPG